LMLILSGVYTPAYGHSVPTGLPQLQLNQPRRGENNTDTGVNPWLNATIMMNPEGMTQNTSATLNDQILRTDGARSVSTRHTKNEKKGKHFIKCLPSI
jgi:hypothetical protein